MNEHSWNSNREKIRSLFPLAKFNNEISQLFQKRFLPLNQGYLADAIDQVKMNYTTFSDNPPELKWFIAEYDKIQQARRNINGVYTQIEKWWVDGEQKSNHTGVMNAWSRDCPDQASAEKLAQEMGGRVRCQHETKNNAQSLIQFLQQQSRETIANAIASLRLDGYLSSEPLPSDYSQWKPTVIGFVSARIQQPTER